MKAKRCGKEKQGKAKGLGTSSNRSSQQEISNFKSFIFEIIIALRHDAPTQAVQHPSLPPSLRWKGFELKDVSTGLVMENA